LILDASDANVPAQRETTDLKEKQRSHREQKSPHIARRQNLVKRPA